MTTTCEATPAEIILEQLGGAGRVKAMVGVDLFVSDDEGRTLMFNFKGCRKANKCRVTLDPSDTYTVKFYKFNRRTLSCEDVREFNGVYAEDLVELFERMTGLFLSL